MEQAIKRINRRSGWSEYENNLLWETADEAQQEGLPLKTVFERISEKTGRRPNSIRNYYYAQVRRREGDSVHTARFVPFTQIEVDDLMEKVLRARANGQSVRSCLQEISGGDHSLMLRYQNKYRSVVKTRPEYVKKLVDDLNAQGIECVTPQVNHRPRTDMRTAIGELEYSASLQNDPELTRAIETLAHYLMGERPADPKPEIFTCAREIADMVHGFTELTPEARTDAIDELCGALTAKADELESLLGDS